jgi:hypothetical protein
MIPATRPNATASPPFANAIGILACFVGSDRVRAPSNGSFPRQNRLGGPGLHHVGSAVRAETLKKVLPPDLFARVQDDAFQEDLAKLQAAVRLM